MEVIDRPTAFRVVPKWRTGGECDKQVTLCTSVRPALPPCPDQEVEPRCFKHCDPGVLVLQDLKGCPPEHYIYVPSDWWDREMTPCTFPQISEFRKALDPESGFEIVGVQFTVGDVTVTVGELPGLTPAVTAPT
jgi:hypothetical protein